MPAVPRSSPSPNNSTPRPQWTSDPECAPVLRPVRAGSHGWTQSAANGSLSIFLLNRENSGNLANWILGFGLCTPINPDVLVAYAGFAGAVLAHCVTPLDWTGTRAGRMPTTMRSPMSSALLRRPTPAKLENNSACAACPDRCVQIALFAGALLYKECARQHRGSE